MTASVISGVVSKKSRKKRTTPYGEKWATSFQINGDWYSGGFKDYNDVNEGDTVQATWEANSRGYKDIKAISVTGKAVGEAGTPEATVVPIGGGGAPRSGGRTFPVDPLAPERTINRQNALTNAVNYCNGLDTPQTPEDILMIAREFEAYTCGDIDREEAEAMMAAEQEG
jgi:hypothetical protein